MKKGKIDMKLKNKSLLKIYRNYSQNIKYVKKNVQVAF